VMLPHFDDAGNDTYGTHQRYHTAIQSTTEP
jgi:hypothetical protein